MITSASNKQVKNVCQLQKKSKARKQQNLFVVEGYKMIKEAPVDIIREIYVSEHFLEDEENVHHMEMLKEKIKNGVTIETVADAVFKQMSDTVTPQGILAVMEMLHYSMEDVLGNDMSHVLVLEGVQDPGNLGTMFRTGEGAGVSGIIMSKDTVDIYNSKTIRSTMGSIYRIPFLIVSDIKEAILQLKENGVTCYAAHLKGEKMYDAFDYCSPCAFLIGNEGNGLTKETADMADTYLKIPMGGQLESLNAAMAAGILMYETNRQRRTMES